MLDTAGHSVHVLLNYNFVLLCPMLISSLVKRFEASPNL